MFVTDGELITIFDTLDLSFAIQCSRILKLQILKATDNKCSHIDIYGIKNQLRNIRDQVNKLLDTLDFKEEPDQIKCTFNSSKKGSIPNKYVTAVDTNQVTKFDQTATENGPKKVNPSEFDPLQEKPKSNTEPSKEQAPQVPMSQANNSEIPKTQVPNIPSASPVAQPTSHISNVSTPQITDYYNNPSYAYSQMPYNRYPYPYPSAG